MPREGCASCPYLRLYTICPIALAVGVGGASFIIVSSQGFNLNEVFL